MNWKVFGITVCIGFAINAALLYCIGAGGDVELIHEQEVEINEPNIKVVSIEVVEPDEPDFVLTFCEATMSLPYKANLFDFIPTWPDYIELEKDLVIHRPGKTENEFIVMYFHKGTHIYFRDDDD